MNNYYFRILLLFSVALFSLFSLSSCQKVDKPKSTLIIKDNLLYKQGSTIPFTGKERAFIENKIIEYEVVDGYKHGEFRIFREDGVIEIEGQLDSNRNVGRWKYYYANGQIESEGLFQNDLPNGLWLWYFPDGKKREEGNYANGSRVGMWYQYDNLGEIIYEINYDSGDTLKKPEPIQEYFKK